jgi:hypothetical protein
MIVLRGQNMSLNLHESMDKVVNKIITREAPLKTALSDQGDGIAQSV